MVDTFGNGAQRARSDFFVSYTSADEPWAEWIAHELEEAGYTVVIQAWDFRPGSNFVIEMQKALRSADRLIAVLSPGYLTARYPQAEWATVFAADPEGAQRRLIPVVVKPCAPDGLLSQVVQIHLSGLDKTAAKRRLLDGMKAGRLKPAKPPAFPGTAASGPATAAGPLGAGARLIWRRPPSPPNVAWRDMIENQWPNQGGYETVELHLVPIGDDARLQVRDLADLSATLPGYGRHHEIFSAVEALAVHSDSTKVMVVAQERARVAGLAVTRAGQRSTWAGLPRDRLGAILDESHLVEQLTKLLHALANLPVPAPEEAVPVVGIEPATMLAVGRIAQLPRNSVQIGHGMPAYVRPTAEDAVSFPAIRTHSRDVAIELAARLVAEHKTVARIV